MTKPTWMLRRATPEDLDAIMRLENATFVSDAWSERTMRGELSSAHSYYLVAVPPDRGDVVNGYAGLRAPDGARQGDIQTIAVAPEARRRGLGRALVQSLINEARKRGVGEVFLDVRTDNPAAQNLYRGFGFREIGVRPRYYQPDDVDAIVMSMAVPDPVTSLATDSRLASSADRGADRDGGRDRGAP